MTGSAVRILRADAPSWAPLVVDVALVTTLVGVCLNQLVWTSGADFARAARAAGVDPAEFGAVSVTIYAVVALLTLLSLTAVGGAAVERNRATFAQWRLMGAAPSQVRRCLVAIVALVSLAGAVPGAFAASALSAAAVPLFDSMALQSLSDGAAFAPPPFHPSAAAWAGSVLVGAVTCLLGAAGPARRASRIEAVEALRGAVPRRRPGLIRCLLGVSALVVGVVMAVAGASAPAGSDAGVRASAMVNAAMYSAVLAALAVHALGPVLVPAVLGGLRPVLARLRAPVGALACAGARAGLGRDGNAVAPLAAAVGLIAAVATTLRGYEATMVTAGFGEAVGSPNYLDTAVLSALLALAAMMTSVSVIVLSGARSRRGFAVLRAQGLSPRQAVALSCWQGLVLALAVLVMAAVPVAVAGIVLAAQSAAVVGRAIVPVPWAGAVLALPAVWLVLFAAVGAPVARAVRAEPAVELRRAA